MTKRTGGILGKWLLCLRLLFIFSLTFCSPTSAQKIYVAVNGSDLGAGTQVAPVKTLHRAAELARTLSFEKPAGTIEILIQPGRYALGKTLLIESGKTDFNGVPVIFRGQPGGRTVLSGGYRIRNFKKRSDTLWKAEIPGIATGAPRFQQLYVNGKRATRARTPNRGYFNPQSIEEKKISRGNSEVAESAVQIIGLSPEAITALRSVNPSLLQDVQLKFYHYWDHTFKSMQQLDTIAGTVTIAGKGMKPWNPIKTSSLLAFENALAFLDEPGEWFLEEDGTLYYYPRKGEKIGETIFTAPLLEQLISVKGARERKVSNITFENIDFVASSEILPQQNFDAAQAAAGAGAAIELDFTDNISIKNCRIMHTGANAVWFRRACVGGLVEGCQFSDLGAGAVKIGETAIRRDSADITRNIRVDNNVFKAGGRFLPGAVAVIIFNASDNVISHNDISDFYYTGISVGWVWGYTPSAAKRNRIVYNHIHHLGQGLLSDMGGVYTLGLSEGTVVSNNLIHDISARDYGGWGLYCDEGSSDILMENNLVYRCGSAGFHQHFGKNNIIRNNIFALNGKAELELTKVEPHNSLFFQNNIVYSDSPEIFAANWLNASMERDSNAYWIESENSRVTSEKMLQQLHEPHSVFADPFFVNPATGNFKFRNSATFQQISLKPFNYSKAGVRVNFPKK